MLNETNDIYLKKSENQYLLSSFGIKENALLILIFGWAGIGIVFSSFLNSVRSKSFSYAFIILALTTIGFCLSTFNENNSVWGIFLIVISFISLLISVDVYYKRFEKNIVIHLVNSGYLGVCVYFTIMKMFPENFPGIWITIALSAPQAIEMLFLCLLFQNIGYYLIWWIFQPFSTPIIAWLQSGKNLVNLSFVKNSPNQLILFLFLSSFGLISRLWNISLGNVYYTDGSGIPSQIGSFLAQFNQLYVVAWLYGYALSLEAINKKNTVTKLTRILIIIEFLYQLFSGSKGRFFNFVILPLACVFILVRKKVSWVNFFLLTMLGAISWLFIYPLLVEYRNLISTISIQSSIEPLVLINTSIQTLLNYSWEKYIETILTPLNSSGIAEQVTAMTSIIHYRVSQEEGLLWQRLLFFWVPRFVWPDKPIILSGNLIGRLSGRLGSEDFVTSVLTTAPGELFLYCGLWGSSLMIFAGLLFRFVNEAISPFKIYSPFRVAVLIAYLPFLQGILSGTFESGLTGIVLQFLTLYIVLLLAKLTVKQHSI